MQVGANQYTGPAYSCQSLFYSGWRHSYYCQKCRRAGSVNKQLKYMHRKSIVYDMSTVQTLISVLSDPYKFCFYCSATHVMSQVLQPKSVNKRYRGTTRLAVYIGLFKKPPIKILQIFDACLNVLARNLNFGSDKLFFFF